MKTFEQLTFDEKAQAIRIAEYTIVDGVASGELEIEMVDPQNQELLECFLSKSRKAEQPRLAKIFLLGEKSIREEITRLAIVVASGSMYDRKGQPIKGVINDEVI